MQCNNAILRVSESSKSYLSIAEREQYRHKVVNMRGQNHSAFPTRLRLVRGEITPLALRDYVSLQMRKVGKRTRSTLMPKHHEGAYFS